MAESPLLQIWEFKLYKAQFIKSAESDTKGRSSFKSSVWSSCIVLSITGILSYSLSHMYQLEYQSFVGACYEEDFENLFPHQPLYSLAFLRNALKL